MITVEEIEKQQEKYQFDKFDNDIAYEIGNIIFNKAKERNLPVAISITKTNQKIFFVSLPGATIINEIWLKRKENSVYHFHTSSMILELQLENVQYTLGQIHGIKDSDFAAAGGCFPIIIKDTGVVGTIGVSGLSSEDDHNLVIEGIKEFLNR